MTKGLVLLLRIAIASFHIVAFTFSAHREIIKKDAIRRREYRLYDYNSNFIPYLCQVLWRDKEFRNQFYFRLKSPFVSFFLNLILPALTDVDLENCPNIGEGFVLIHGHGTIINRFSSIGKNCTIYHGVTIGSIGGGYPPTIGDNVFIGCDAKVLGDIKIGNNVKIGAGAVVVKDVPDNVTVIGVPAYILKK